MRCTLLFRVEPTSVFGLPDGDKVVVPEGMPIQRSIDPRTGQPIDRGTVSQYRAQNELLTVRYLSDDLEVVVKDDYFFLSITADNPEDGYTIASELMRQLVRLMMVGQGCYLEPVPIQFELEDGGARKIGKPSTILVGTSYSLPRLREAIAIALPRLKLQDAHLTKCLQYFEHARYLMDVARNYRENHSPFIQASAFLYYWKSLTTILGDPASDKAHQTRYREIGLPEDFWNKNVKPMKKLRDTADVAHHSLDAQSASQVIERIPAIDALCRKVIDTYAKKLVADV